MENLRENVMAWLMDEASNNEAIELVSCVNAWNGSLQEYEYYDMTCLDEFFSGVKPTEFLGMLSSDFNVNDEFYHETIYGLESCSEYDAAKDIKDNADEVIDVVIDNFDNLDLPFSLENYLEEIDLEEE